MGRQAKNSMKKRSWEQTNVENKGACRSKGAKEYEEYEKKD